MRVAERRAERYSIRTLGEGSPTAEWTGSVTYYDHPNPFYFGLIDVVSFRIDDMFTPQIAANGFVGVGWGDIDATVISRVIKFENMHVSQPARNFEIDVPFDVATHRFMCSRVGEGQCVWPNGEEAGFGMAGR